MNKLRDAYLVLGVAYLIISHVASVPFDGLGLLGYVIGLVGLQLGCVIFITWATRR